MSSSLARDNWDNCWVRLIGNSVLIPTEKLRDSPSTKDDDKSDLELAIELVERALDTDNGAFESSFMSWWLRL